MHSRYSRGRGTLRLEVKHATAGQRRRLTILFSDLSDSTRLSGQMDQEDFAELLEGLRKLFRKIIPAYGGQIVSIQGDGVLAIFGYPEVRENDARRATEAALDLHAAVRALTTPALSRCADALELHSGIHGGLVYLSPGDVELGRFAFGSEVSNTAARLSAEAGRGEIYVSEETLGPDVHHFSVSERSPRALKGRVAPLPVFRILGRAPAQSRFRGRSARGLTPFVGRDEELRALREEACTAASGAPRCVLITGDPGLGKTRLVEELLRDAAAEPFRILRGYCESDLAAEPLQPFVQMLRTVCGVRPGMSAAEAAASAERALAAIPLEGTEMRGALMQALSLAKSDAQRAPLAGGTMAALHGLFDALARERPLLLMVDELQWADDSSRQMLYAVQTVRRPLLLLLVSRGDIEDAPAGQSGRRIVLAPLARDAAMTSIRHLAPGADPFVVDDIYRDGGGNPLFIEELCHSAAADRAWRRGSHAGGAGWLSTLIESRIARLEPRQAEVLRAAAVIGNAVPAWLLGSITGSSENDPTVRALAEQDFLFPAEQTGTMRFKHGITRAVVYDSIGLRARKQLHGTISAALAERYAAGAAPAESYESLAYHNAAAGLSEQAARFAELAGDKAMAALALDRAQAQYAAALAALDGFVPITREVALRWCAVAQKLGMACVFDTLALPNGVALFERAVALARQAGDAEALARAEYWLGYVCYARGLGLEGARHCQESLTLCERIGEQRLLAQVRVTLGQALAAICDYDRALALLDAGLDSKRRNSRPGSGVAVGSAYSLACKGGVLGDRGLFAQADECFQEALALLGSTPHQVGSSVRGWMAVVYLWQGRWEEAIRVGDEDASIAEEVRSRLMLSVARAITGYARWVVSGRTEALQLVRDATSWMEDRGGAFFVSLNYGWLVDGAVASGWVDEARRHAARLFVRARQRERLGEAMGCRALARAAANAGDFAGAGRYLELAMRSAEARGSPHERAKTQLCRAGIEIGRGRRAEARALLDAASDAFESMRMPWFLAQAAALRSSV